MKKVFASMALLFAMCSGASAQTPGLPRPGTRKPGRNLQNSKFGIFIHFGIYSMFAQGEWYLSYGNVDCHEYAKAASGFYPSKFDADAWAEAIKSIRGTVCLLHHAPPRRLLDVRHGIFGLRHRGRVALQKKKTLSARWQKLANDTG